MNEFNLNNKLLTQKDIVEIVENYKILHFDEFPILYFGTNRFGNKIIGSHLDEFDEEETILALHTILSNKEYYQFVNRKKSYLEILQNSNSIYIVEKDYNSEIKKVYNYNFNSIPIEYLPLENSFCPTITNDSSFNYSITLKGKIADVNKAIANQVASFQKSFFDLIEEKIKSFKGLGIIPQVMLKPSSPGSFKINFELDLQKKDNTDSLFLQVLPPLDKYLTHYIKYIVESLHDDKEIFMNDNAKFSSQLKELEDILIDIYDKSCIKKPNNFDQFLKDDIIKSLNKFESLTDQIGNNYDNITIYNVINEEENPIAYLDKDFSESFQKNVEEIEDFKIGSITDATFQNYKIYIYHLNTDTRSGNALIKDLENEYEMSKPKIKINGSEGLEQTKYTESLYLNKWIDVKAKAKRVGHKFKFLDIEFD